MLKRILPIMMTLLIAVWLLPAAAFAHSQLETATPGVDAKVDVSPEQIQLTFDTRIESLSNFRLFNSAGEQIETGRAEVDGDTMTGAVPTTLGNDSYTVKWTIIGADGHAVEGEYYFAVDAPQTEATPPPTEEAAEEEADATPEPSPSPVATAEPDNAGGLKSLLESEGILPFIMVGVIIAGVGILTVLARRRK